MRPRSSRSHSTFVPAESMTASTPHVVAPPRRQATIGKRAARAPRVERRAASAPTHEVEHAAGAEGDLGQPGPHAALADERRLLVAGDAADRRRAGRARRPRRPRPTSRRSSGRIDSGMRSASSSVGAQPRPSAVQQPGDAGVGRVGDVGGAAATASTRSSVSTVPKQQVAGAVGVGHVEQELRPWWPTRSARGGCPAPAASRHIADGAQVLPADARADGLAGGAVPHDRRRPLVGDADGVDGSAVGERRRGPRRARRRPSRRRRTRRSPGAGDVGQHLAVVDVVDGRVGPHDRGAHAARADVDDEDRHRGSWARRGGRRRASTAAEHADARGQQRVEHDRRSG